MNNAQGCAKDDPGNAACGCSPTPSLAACEATFEATANATSFTWHDSTTGSWALQCCLRHDGVWNPYAEAGHTSGRSSLPLNVYSAAVAVPPTGVPELRVNGVRVPRARYPNANPETDQFPVGWVPSGGETWLPPKTPTLPLVEVNVSNAALLLRNSTQNGNYVGAVGGPCDNFEPPFSYWCSAHPVRLHANYPALPLLARLPRPPPPRVSQSGGGGFQYYVPSGVTLSPGLLPFDFPTPATNPPVFQVSCPGPHSAPPLASSTSFPSCRPGVARLALGKLDVRCRQVGQHDGQAHLWQGRLPGGARRSWIGLVRRRRVG